MLALVQYHIGASFLLCAHEAFQHTTWRSSCSCSLAFLWDSPNAAHSSWFSNCAAAWFSGVRMRVQVRL